MSLKGQEIEKVYSKTEVVNEVTGEVLQTIREGRLFKEGQFIKLYKLSMKEILNLNGQAIKVLFLFVYHMDSDNKSRLRDVVEDGTLKRSYITGQLNELLEKGFVIKLKPGLYRVNLSMFSKTNKKRNLELQARKNGIK